MSSNYSYYVHSPVSSSILKKRIELDDRVTSALSNNKYIVPKSAVVIYSYFGFSTYSGSNVEALTVIHYPYLKKTYISFVS